MMIAQTSALSRQIKVFNRQCLDALGMPLKMFYGYWFLFK